MLYEASCKGIRRLQSYRQNRRKLRKERKIKQKDFIARLQVFGLDINPTSYSKLEGQVRIATDKEVYAIAKVLGVEMEELYK